MAVKAGWFLIILAILMLRVGATAQECDPGPCGGGEVEAYSLFGEPLLRPVVEGEFAARHSKLLEQARAEFIADNTDADALVWVGRRFAYLGQYGDAIQVYEDGIRRFPADARFRRHLGHRLISIREFDRAEGVLERAAAMMSGEPNQVEPDGLPNAAGIPTSTLKGNIWYHLGLVRYLKGDFSGCGEAYETTAAIAANPDAMVAARYWIYLCHARAGDMARAEAALEPVVSDLDIIENFAYFRLALAFKGEIDANDFLEEVRAGGAPSLAALGYGLAAKRLVDGDRAGAEALMREILATGAWSAFGYIAAEADLARGLE